MNLQLFPEEITYVAFRLRVLARLAVILSAPLSWVSPYVLEKVLTFIINNRKSATYEEVLLLRNAVCCVSKKCQNQDGCLKRSIAVIVATCMTNKSAVWCSGYALDPFRAHAWVEVNGIPVGENDETTSYTKVLSAPMINKGINGMNVIENVEEANISDSIDFGEKKIKVSVRQLFSLAKGHNKEFAIVMILGLLCAILTLIQPELVSNIISYAQNGVSIQLHVIILIIVLVISTLLTTIQYYLLQVIGEGVVYNARTNVISHLLRLPIIEYSIRSNGDLLSRMIGDTSKLRMAFIQGIIAFSSGIFVVVGAAVGMAIKDMLLFLTAVVTVAFSFVGIILMSGLIQKYSYYVQKELGKLSSLIERDLLAIRTIRATNSTPSEEKKAVRQAEKLRDLGIKLAKIQSLMTPISNMSLQVCGLIVLGLGGYRVSLGYMSIADLIAFALLLYMMIGPIGQIFGAFSGVGESLGAFQRVCELLEIVLEDEIPSNTPVNLPNIGVPLNSAVHFEKVDFGYNKSFFGASELEQEEILTLKGITLTARKGERIAIVGPSGAGKSTILHLIERFFEIDNGDIYIEGKNYLSYSREELRNTMTYVEQNVPILSGTLKENLLMGNSNISDEACYKALEMVNLSYLLERSSSKLDLELGESGAKLSGGEKQRLAIARSLLSEANIVILDELTANLDSINEAEIKRAINNMRGIKTVIVVAHRLSTIVDSDLIYVLEHGRIVGYGSHNQLLDTVPLYRELAKEQFLDKPITVDKGYSECS